MVNLYRHCITCTGRGIASRILNVSPVPNLATLVQPFCFYHAYKQTDTQRERERERERERDATKRCTPATVVDVSNERLKK